MDTMNRREVCWAMAALAMAGGRIAEAQTAPQPAGALPPGGEEHTGPVNTDLAPLESRVYRFEDLKVTPNAATGGWSRAVMHGALPTGEFMELHETMLPPGTMPHPPHRHRNTEFLLIRQGTLEYLNEGKPERVGPGDVVYSASEKMHGVKNVGDDDAIYFVVSVSHGQM